MGWLLSFVVRLGFDGIVDKALDHLRRRAELGNDAERLKSETTVKLAELAVTEARMMTEFNRAKLNFPFFWIFAALFVVPLGLWWSAVILDSIFMFEWSVADLPTPQMQEWAGTIIMWGFYVGVGVSGLRDLRR